MRNIRNCSVCVTGGAGFLGSHLVNHLVDDRNCQVLVIDNLVAGRREFVHKDAIFEHHDLTGSESRTLDLFKQHKVKYVFSYFAYPYIPISFARPIHVNDVNFMGAMKVINAAQEAGAEAILQVSSAEIYGDAGETLRLKLEKMGMSPDRVSETSGQRIDENATVCPHSSYGVAKAAVDNWVQVRWREAKTPCIALRQFNCVGERENHPYIVPEIISQLVKQQRLVTCSDCGGTGESQPSACHTCKGTGEVWEQAAKVQVRLGNNSFRDFLYAGDAVRLAVELLERGQFGEVYNLGSETGIKMYDLAKLIGKVMGFASVEVVPDPARVRPWEIWFLMSCNDKLKSLGVSAPTTDLKQAIRKTVDWYNTNGRRWTWER